MIVKVANLLAIQRDAIYNHLSSNDIYNMFNDFLLEFERLERSKGITGKIFLDAVEDIVDAVFSILPYKLLDLKVLYHPIMYFLHQVFITKLNKWSMLHLSLNIQEMDIFLKIMLIFIRIAEQTPIIDNDKDRNRIRNLSITKQFLFKIHEQIDTVFLSKQNFDDDTDICALGLLIIKLLQEYPFRYSIGRNEDLICDLIMNCLDSYDYTQIMDQLQRGESLTDIDYYILSTCWEYLSITTSNKQDSTSPITPIDLIYCLTDEILTRVEQTLSEQSRIVPSALTYIFEKYYQFLLIQNPSSFDKHANFIIDYLINILQKPSSTNLDDKILINIALEAFNKLSKNTDIQTMMKKRQLTSIFNKYTSSDMGDKRKLAFNILAEIMDEKEINNNSTDITITFIEQLKQLNPNEYNPNVDSTLTSIRALMPHEQVKSEFIKQEGLTILITFVCNSDIKNQLDKQLIDVLKILWSCTFNNPEILNKFKENMKLMTRVNEIFEYAKQNKNNRLEKAAEGLIWKVEKEEKFKQEHEAEAERKKQKAQENGVEEEESEQYDLMISYSWADKELAHRIFKHLTEKSGYKVWIDQEQMHGSTIGAMASAVENAQFILMCMSETYKKSTNCQSEAEYAFSRKKHIVPIKMKKDYVPDGWLGFILGTRMYIDFDKHEFDKAIELLENEIQLQKNSRKEAKEIVKEEIQVEEDHSNQKQRTEEEIQTCLDHKEEEEEEISMENIKTWNEKNVRNFLRKKNLSNVLLLCDGLNGMELFDLYAMCRSSSILMYRFLKFELSKVHDKVLLISTYLHFINCLREICDNDAQLSAYVCTEDLEEYLQDDE